jgi:ADP-heptose:LPS heptosyltransferase
MISRRRELFVDNPDVDEVIAPDEQMLACLSHLPGKLTVPVYHKKGHNDGAYDTPEEHILVLMCRIAGISGEVELRPVFHLSEDEKNSGIHAPLQIAVQSEGTNFPTKNWYPARFQEVIDAFRKEVTFVQIGGKDDHLLHGVIDQRGNSFRETASILHNSHLFLGLVGFFMHLARSVECPSAIIYGGREAPWQGGYSCNENIVNAPHCSPCWHAHRCDYDMQCMDQIKIPQVIAAVQKLLDRPRDHLPVDKVTI